MKEICLLDNKSGELVKNILKLSDDEYVESISGDYLWARKYGYDGNDYEVTLYNIKNSDYINVYKGTWEGMPIVNAEHNGMFYGYYSEDEYFHPNTKLFVYDTSKREFRDLIEESQQPGIAGYFFSLFNDGVAITDTDYYYLSSDKGKVLWKRYNFESGQIYNTKVVAHEFEWMNYAEAEVVRKVYNYPDSDRACYRFYNETVRLNDNIENADKINKVLADIDNELKESVEKEASVMDDSMREDMPEMSEEEWFCYSMERSLSDIYKIGTHYISINYNGYNYYGGAHGMPYNEHFLFDTNTGEIVTLRDLCDMDDAVFKNMVAMKTVEMCQNNEDSYFYDSYSYGQDGGAVLYSDVQEFANKDMAVDFKKDCLMIEYPPYLYGPYASGFLYIPISYEELEINID